MKKTSLIAAAAAVVLIGLTACSTSPEAPAPGSSSGAAATEWKTSKPGVLSVILTDFPYKGFVEGDDPTKPTSGYYVEMVEKIAGEMGLKVEYRKGDLSALLANQIQGWDMAVSTYSVTPEREKIFEMTAPVTEFYKAIFTKAGVKATSKADVQNMVLGAGSTTVNFKFITDDIKPNKQPQGFAQDVTKYDAVLTGQIDGGLGDLYVSLAKTKEAKYAGTAVACKWKTPSTGSWALPKGSPLIAQVNKSIEKMRTDGTMKGLVTKYVVPLAGGADPDAVPLCPEFP